MIRFKTFVTGQYSDREVGEFFNEHLIETSKVLENGNITVFYREIDDLGLDHMDLLERLNNAIKEAEKIVFDAELGITECDGNLADIEAEIAKTTPNEKDKWDALQGARRENEDQRTMHQKTIEGRNRQVFDLREAVKDALAKNK